MEQEYTGKEDMRQERQENAGMSASKAYSRTGAALFVMGALTSAVQILLSYLSGEFAARGYWFAYSGWYTWVVTFVPLYLVGMPVCVWIMQKVPEQKPNAVKFGGKEFFVFFLMCLPLMYGGNIIGNVLSMLFSGGQAQNGLLDYAFDTSLLKVLVMVILAPLLEEFVFRKQIIDRCGKYGEKPAILFSALTFGLFHMNLFQFFYAFGLGLVFAYVYTRTRRLRYPVIMHMIINFMGAVIAPSLLTLLDMEALMRMSEGVVDEAVMLSVLPGLAMIMLYFVLLLGLSIAGIVLICLRASRLVFLPAAYEIPKGRRFRSVYCNAGVVLFVLFCVVMIVLTLV